MAHWVKFRKSSHIFGFGSGHSCSLGRLALGRVRLPRWLCSLTVAAIGLLLGGLWLSQPAQAGPQQQPTTPQRLLLGIAPGAEPAGLEAQLAAAGLGLDRFWPSFGVAAARPTGARQIAAVDLLAAAQALPVVRYAEWDGPVEAAVLDSPASAPANVPAPSATPNDPFYPAQYALPLIGMPEAWAVSIGSPEVVVALIDSGFDTGHEDLSPDVLWTNPAEAEGVPGVDDDGNGFVDDISGWDWVSDSGSIQDPFGHGTHVGGVLAASTGNGVGVTAAGRRLRLMPLRVLDARGNGFISDLLDALHYAQAQGARIVNLSLILRVNSQAVHDAVAALAADDLLVVAATGNNGSQVYWPAAYPETLAVAAVNAADVRAGFSNPGPETDVAAPGAGILSTYANNSYYVNDGTSMATPHVAALASLVWAVRPDLTAQELRALILATAADVNAPVLPGPDEQLGAGRIDAGAALRQASVGVALGVAFPPNRTLRAGESISVPVALRLLAAGGTDVRGGVVGYEIQSPFVEGAVVSGASLVEPGDETTAASASAMTVTLPSAPGPYTAEFRFGVVTRTFPLVVQDGPLGLFVEVEQSVVPVGGSTRVLVSVRTGDGEPYPKPLPIRLETGRGRWEGGGQVLQGVALGGTFQARLHPGQTVGPVQINLWAGGQSQLGIVRVAAVQPDKIAGPAQFLFPADLQDRQFPIALTVTDRFGNPVEAPEDVRFYTAIGSFSPAAAPTEDGIARSTLTLPPGQGGPVTIWAGIPGTFASYRGQVTVLRHHVHFPLIRQGSQKENPQTDPRVQLWLSLVHNN